MQLKAQWWIPFIVIVTLIIGLLCNRAAGEIWLKQSTAVTVKLGPFIDEDDGKTAETGLTITQAEVRISKNGGNIIQKDNADALGHDELGVYDCNLSTTDTGTLGRLKVFVHESGAGPVWEHFMVVPANIWDSYFSTDKLQVDINQVANDAITDNGDGMLEVNVEKIDDDDASPPNLEIMFDATDFASWYNSTDDLVRTDVNQVGGTDVPVPTAELVNDGGSVAEVGNRLRYELEKAVDGDPNAGSIAERIKTMDDAFTATRGGYLDKLNVSGTLAHSDAASTYKATGFSTHGAADVWTNGTRTLTALDEDDTTIDMNGTTIGTVDTLTGHTAQTGDTYSLANNETYGFSAIETLVDGIETKTDNLPTDPADDSDIDAAIAALQTIVQDANDNTKAIVDAIQAKTDNLPTDPADDSDIDGQLANIQAEVENIDGEAMRGTDNAALAATALSNTTWTDAKAGYITGDVYARVGEPAGASIAADIAAVGIDANNAAIDANTAAQGAGGAGATAQQVWEYADRQLTALDEDTTTIDINNTAVGSVEGAVGSVTGNVGGNVTGSVGSLATQAKADVNAEVDTALSDYDAPTKTEFDSGLAGLNDPSETEIVAALMGDTGFTAGGTMTFEELLKFTAAWLIGDWYDKVGDSTTQQILDPDDGATVILEIQASDTSPYKQINTSP